MHYSFNELEEVADRLSWRPDDIVLVMSFDGNTFSYQRCDAEEFDVSAIEQLTEFGVQVCIDVIRPFKLGDQIIRSSVQLI